MTAAIVAKSVGKQFRRVDPDRPRTLQEAMVRRWFRRETAAKFWALRDVSFSVQPGRMVGLIGHNGAGKSTLLRLLGGVGRPDAGQVQVQGRIGALLDLGASFHGDLTGRENVFISGVIGGLTRQEVAARFDDIVAFAELEDFIDSPLRTYSSGMQMRIAFAVAVHIDPGVLLIDEVLAVGDMAFQRKCLDRIEAFRAAGCAIVLVSHDTEMVRRLCDEVIWLQSGQVAAHGPADVVVEQYTAAMSAETRRRTPANGSVHRLPAGATLQLNQNRFGSQEMAITAVRLLDESGRRVTTLESGAALRVQIDYRAPQPITAPIFGVTISREDNFACYDVSTEVADLPVNIVHGAGQVILELARLDLAGGKYYVDVGVYEQEWAYAYDYHWHAYPLLIAPAAGGKGVLQPPHRWQID